MSIFITNINANKAVANINRCLGSRGPSIGMITMRPTASPMLSRKGDNPRGVRKVNTKFIPGTLGARICSRIFPIRGRSTFAINGLVTGRRKVLINVSSNTTLCTTVRLTGEPRGGKGAVMTLLPSSNSHCCSAPLFIWGGGTLFETFFVLRGYIEVSVLCG